ncbi:MAG: 2-phosphosulfolactate phosphatase [Spirochaetales bacterium]|jgi:2-phosphosulfolactate phosphatase|nr:2-phosphosulfolactate phosphatase [Spirochaetales bacterium]
MKLDAVFTAEQCREDLVKGKTAVIIDVLRSTTVITTALNNGALWIVPFAKAGEALAFRDEQKQKNPAEILLAGEYRCVKLPGFDLDNSPRLYDRKTVENKIIAMVTTNGTVSIMNARPADSLYILCMLNMEALARRLVQENRDTVFVCSGAIGRFSLEDGICAAVCIDRIHEKTGCGLTDAASLLWEFYRTRRENIQQVLYSVDHSQRLRDWGFGADLAPCFTLDTTPLVPVYESGLIKASL